MLHSQSHIEQFYLFHRGGWGGGGILASQEGRRDTQHDGTQHNDTQYRETQYNDTQHKYTQHKDSPRHEDT
jgi:hypothetical protein